MVAAGGKGCCSLFNWLLVAAFLVVIHVYHSLFSNQLLAVVPEHVDHFSVMKAAINSTTATEDGLNVSITKGTPKDESHKSPVSMNEAQSFQNSSADDLISEQPDLKDSAHKSNITSDIDSQNIIPKAIVVISGNKPQGAKANWGAQESSTIINTPVANSQNSQC